MLSLRQSFILACFLSKTKAEKSRFTFQILWISAWKIVLDEHRLWSLKTDDSQIKKKLNFKLDIIFHLYLPLRDIDGMWV